MGEYGGKTNCDDPDGPYACGTWHSSRTFKLTVSSDETERIRKYPVCPNPYCDGTGWVDADGFRAPACRVGPHDPLRVCIPLDPQPEVSPIFDRAENEHIYCYRDEIVVAPRPGDIVEVEYEIDQDYCVVPAKTLAARLVITNVVRVCLVQEAPETLSPNDCGIYQDNAGFHWKRPTPTLGHYTAVQCFVAWWNTNNPDHRYDSNPYVAICEVQTDGT